MVFLLPSPRARRAFQAIASVPVTSAVRVQAHTQPLSTISQI